jgi:hypothetical protein
MISYRTRESVPPLLVLLAIVAMSMLLYRYAHGAVGAPDPAPASPPFDWSFWSGVAIAVATAGSYVLHAIAGKTHSAKVEAVAKELDVLRRMVGPLVPAVGVPTPVADKPAAAPPIAIVKGTGTASMLIVLLLGAVAVPALTSCASGSTARGDAATGLVAALNCEDGSIDPGALSDAAAFAAAKVQAWISGTAPTDLAGLKTKILADLAPVKSNLGRCAIASALAVVAAVAAPKPTPGVATSALFSASPGPDPQLVRAAFAGAARAAGWAPVRVASGEVL